MKFTRLILFGLFAGISITELFAQKETTNWFFGDKAGFQFDRGSPTPFVTSTWFTENASAVQSDPTSGKLLFYTNSEVVWDSKNAVMPHGGNLAGNSFLSQSCLIVPNPADNEQYYLFTLSDRDLPDPRVRTVSLYSSLIDTRLNAAKGDIVSDKKNNLLQHDISEKMIAIKHGNGRDYWIITHSLIGNIFFIRLLSINGISDAKQIAIGSVYNSNIGCMQASPDGSKIACAVWKSVGTRRNDPSFDLFNFDNQTGNLSNYINLGFFSRQYGVCFSPDNSKLYLTHQTPSPDSTQQDYIRQYDLEAGSNDAIMQSGMSINVNNPTTNIPAVRLSRSNSDKATFYAFSIQNAPNGRIYGVTLGGFCQFEECGQDSHSQRFIVINKPNVKGFGCDVQLQDFPLGIGRINNTQGLPNFIQSSFNNLKPQPISDCGNYDIVIYPNPVTDVFYVLYKENCFKAYSLRIINVVGQVLQTTNIESPMMKSFSLAQFPPGIYLVEIIADNNKQVIKIMKR